jgi:nitrous oxidase accessory protein NosD
VITLAPGTYVGDFVVERGVNGTPENPIFIRGSDREAVVLRGKTSHGFQIYGDYVTLEDITLEAGKSGIGLVARDCEGVVIRRNWITNVDKGIMLTRGSNRNFDIYKNVLGGETGGQISAGRLGTMTVSPLRAKGMQYLKILFLDSGMHWG